MPRNSLRVYVVSTVHFSGLGAKLDGAMGTGFVHESVGILRALGHNGGGPGVFFGRGDRASFDAVRSPSMGLQIGQFLTLFLYRRASMLATKW